MVAPTALPRIRENVIDILARSARVGIETVAVVSAMMANAKERDD